MDFQQLKNETEKLMEQTKANLPNNLKGNEKVLRIIRDMEFDLNDEGVYQAFQINLKPLLELSESEDVTHDDPELGNHGYKFSDYLLEWKEGSKDIKMFKLFLTNRPLEQSRLLQTCPGDYLQCIGPLLTTFVQEMVRQNTRI